MTGSGKHTLADLWKRWRAPLVWLVVGLVVGPLISNAIGWQVTARTDHSRVQKAIVHQQAAMCEMRARANTKDLSHLNFDQKGALAQKYAKFPWTPQALQAVVDQCGNALAAQTTATTAHSTAAKPAAKSPHA